MPASTENLRRLQLLRLRKRKAEELSHMQSGSAVPAFVPPEEYSPVELGAWQQFQAGRARGNVEETQAALGGEAKKDAQGNLLWRKSAKDPWQSVNAQGLTWGDIPATLGETVGPTIGATVAGLTARTPLGMIAKATLGGGLGSLAEQGVQLLEGTQRQGPGAVLRQAATDAALEGAGAGAGALLSKIGGGLTPQSNWAEQELRNAIEFQKGGVGYPSPLAADILGKTGAGPVPAPVMKGVERQAEGMTGHLSGLRQDMATQAADAVRHEFLLPEAGREAVNRSMVEAATRAKDEMAGGIARGGPGLEAGAHQLRKGGEAAGEVARSRVAEQYRGPLASALQEEKPVFDLGPVQKKWNAPKLDRTVLRDTGLVDRHGAPITEALLERVEAVPDAPGKVGYLKSVLSSLDPEQTSFEAIKGVRTVVGDLLQDPAFRDAAGRPARRLYGELTEVLKAPKNLPPGSKYVKEFENANLLTQWQHGLLDDASVAKALKGQGSGNIVRDMVSSPEALLTPKFREFMDLAPENTRTMFRKSVQQAILDRRDPTAILEKWDSPANPAPYNYLFASPGERRAFESHAAKIAQFWDSAPGRMYDKRLKGYETTRYAVEQVQDPKQARELWGALKAPERESLRSALVDNTVDKVLKPNPKTGTPVVDTGALETEIAALKKRGTWALLSADQRKRVQGMASYYRTVLARSGDVGASLETASAVADMKGLMAPWDPPTFVRGLRSIQTVAHNRLLARYLTNPKRAQRLISRVGKAPRDVRVWAIPAMLSAPYLGTAASEAGEDAGSVLDALLSFETSAK